MTRAETKTPAQLGHIKIVARPAANPAAKPAPSLVQRFKTLLHQWPEAGTKAKRGQGRNKKVIAHVGDETKRRINIGGVFARLVLTALAAEVFFIVLKPGEVTLELPELRALSAPADASCALRVHTGNTAVDPHWGSIRQWCPAIMRASESYHFDPYLLASLMLIESGGQSGIISRSGAVGLMQVMPRDGIAAGFQCISGPCFASRPSIAELKDPDFNVDYGARLLASNVERTGSLREALAAYGPNNVGYSYADKVLGIFETIKE